jgi:hypothetical protein
MKPSLLWPRRILAMMLASGVVLAVTHAATINVEVDYMVGTHSHRPQANEIAAVVQMFACAGITLNVVVNEVVPHVNVMPRDPGNPNRFFEYAGTDGFKWYKNTYFDHADDAGWHYCIFGHQYQDTDYTTTGSSGLGETLGDDFVVTLGDFDNDIGTAFDRAATFAHELGHNLGLGHGEYDPRPLNKPSIMSYFYQLRGVKTALLDHGLTTETVSLFKELDYSRDWMVTLNEAALDEQAGTWMTSVDWNCNGIISGEVSQSLDDANDWCDSTATDRHILEDVDEWAKVRSTLAKAIPKSLADRPTVSCITAQEARRLKSLRGVAKAQPSVASEPCVSGAMLYLKPGELVTGDGAGSNPSTTLTVPLLNGPPDGSHFIFFPGRYELDPGPVVIGQPMKMFCPTGKAVVNPK